MVKRPVAPGGENGPNTIFKVSYPAIVLVEPKLISRATYSGVPVYEMLCRTVAVMRRRSDAYLNATQILKVAGFDKPQRTRVLEREVQKGEHEKVQGGYGKYQGTWIPIERGLALAKQYGVEDLLRPLIDYVPTSVSPPPAPKHAVAPPTKAKKEKDKKESATAHKTGPTSAAALTAQAQLATRAAGKQAAAKKPAPASTPDADTSRSMESLPASPEDDDDSSSDTPSPVTSVIDDKDRSAGVGMDIDMDGNQAGSSTRKRTAQMMMDEQADYLRQARGQSAVHTPQQSPVHLPMMDGVMAQQLGPEAYTDIILNYFISETTQIPSILVSPPADFDPNTRIDEDSHSALHWACAMGRVRVVKLLLTAGASIFAANNSEQTPLMRSVMFSNNYDVRKFPELYELLHRSTLNIDKYNRTVFHHIANLALSKGKTHAARYYMETILSRLADFPQELADVINFQDEDGETALTLAARARSRRLVKALLDHGADPKIKNRDYKSAEDYILEDERFRSSPVSGGKRDPIAHQLFSSEAARLVGGSCLQDITSHMQALAKSFDGELQGKERDILQAKALLTSIHTEVTETTRILQGMGDQSGPVADKKRELEGLQAQLRASVGASMRRGYEGWVQGDEARQGRWQAGGVRGEDYSDLPALTDIPPGGAEVGQAEEERLRWEIEEKRKRRATLVKQYVRAQAEAGTGQNIGQYRRLISAGCGGQIAVHEVDNVMTQLLETLESEGTGLAQDDVSWMS